MPTLNQLIRHGREEKRRTDRTRALDQCPQKEGVCPRVSTRTPKKPNSALRKIAKVQLSNKHDIFAHIPGEGHNSQEHSKGFAGNSGSKKRQIKIWCGKTQIDMNGRCLWNLFFSVSIRKVSRAQGGSLIEEVELVPKPKEELCFGSPLRGLFLTALLTDRRGIMELIDELLRYEPPYIRVIQHQHRSKLHRIGGEEAKKTRRKQHNNTTGRSEVRIEEFKTKPTDGRVSEDLERKKAAVAAERGAEYATAIQGHLGRRPSNAYPWDPSFAAGGQNHRLTSSFDILPGVKVFPFVLIKINHSPYGQIDVVRIIVFRACPDECPTHVISAKGFVSESSVTISEASTVLVSSSDDNNALRMMTVAANKSWADLAELPDGVPKGILRKPTRR
ncbi:hypothetical protein SASPL_155497 (mitochondrion) [Salvia splendens]|uniref:Uncharacterized protein n=1 Tax=Salvia splendens TaxID=180675 RepID=A0A8X8VX18_SALSN|nr:hypothetical protein SASPL_156304 [Salvia splendens]KAG6384652.1 hypothetical protein SASPL_155497 [Salvia splendens]